MSPRDKAATAGAGHTPGPWRVDDQTNNDACVGFGIHSADEWIVADVHADIKNGDEQEALANARLIAAAPTMRDMVIASAHAVCSAVAYPNTSVEQRWLRDRWLIALDALGLTEGQARVECSDIMRGIYATPPSQAPDATGGGL